jgi:hypothetical protein
MASDGAEAVGSDVDDVERDALRDEGLDSDDPAVIAAVDLVAWELSLLRP